ncbi:MAG: deoxyribonuclease IV [Atopobiaceae bacterium]|nr:deoxyribonuclease IV [Atopobiaceae bacterium]
MALSIGSHLSSSRGLLAMGEDALSIGATTFAFFTRNPRGGNARDYDPADADALVALMSAHGFGPLVAHAPYTMNLCSAKPDVREFGIRAMREDLARLELLGGSYYNFHPGSHVGQGIDRGVELIVDALDQVLDPACSTTVLLETMAGKGSEVGSTFEGLAAIIAGVRHPECLGVCLDTCHVHDAGYDVVNDLDGVLARFDEAIGLDRLRALHLNDSKNPLGSHKDRHERIGEGRLGVDAFERIVRHPRLRLLPMILETPNELEGYAREIALLRSLAGEA